MYAVACLGVGIVLLYEGAITISFWYTIRQFGFYQYKEVLYITLHLGCKEKKGA